MARSVIIIDPVTNNRIRLAALLGRAQYEIGTAATVAEAAAMKIEPDLIVLATGNGRLSDLIDDAKCRLTGDRSVPVICLDDDAGPMRRLQAFRAGARELLPRSSPDPLLLALFRGMIRDTESARELARRSSMARGIQMAESAAPFERPGRVICISDVAATAESIGLGLHGHVVTSISATDDLRSDLVADAFVISSGPDASLMETLLPELRDGARTRHAPFVVLYPADRPDLAVTALNLGAADVTADTATGEELALRITRLLSRKRLGDHVRDLVEESCRLAMIDPLTGLYNRRYAEVYMSDVVTKASDSGRGFVVMMLDIDHFKAVNDRYGHPAGDCVLKVVADRIRENLRAIDLVARFGGEEFLIVLPETEADEAEQAAQRLRRLIGGVPVMLDDGSAINVTASIGVAICGGSNHIGQVRTGTFDMPESFGWGGLQPLLSAADAALYQAKSNGRNRVELSRGA